MSITTIRQYGMKRTGTNYLKKLMELNFQNIRIIPHKKHKLPNINHPYVDIFILSLKDPFQWITSFIKWSRECGDTTIKSVKSLSIKQTNTLLNKWLDFNNGVIKHGITFPATFAIVSYTDLISDYKNILKYCERLFELERAQKNFHNEGKEIASSGHYYKDKRSFNYEYYLNKKYMSLFTPKIKEHIKDNTPKMWKRFLNKYTFSDRQDIDKQIQLLTEQGLKL